MPQRKETKLEVRAARLGFEEFCKVVPGARFEIRELKAAGAAGKQPSGRKPTPRDKGGR